MINYVIGIGAIIIVILLFRNLIKKEMGNWKDTLKTIGFQMLVAWIIAFIVYIICGFIF